MIKYPQVTKTIYAISIKAFCYLLSNLHLKILIFKIKEINEIGLQPPPF